MRAESGDIVDAFGIELPVWTLLAATGAVGLLLLSIASRRAQQDRKAAAAANLRAPSPRSYG